MSPYLPATTHPQLPPPHTMMSNSSGNGDILMPSLASFGWLLSSQPDGNTTRTAVSQTTTPPRKTPVSYVSVPRQTPYLPSHPRRSRPLSIIETPEILSPFPFLNQLTSARYGWPMPPRHQTPSCTSPCILPSPLHSKFCDRALSRMRMHLWEPLISVVLGVARVTAAWTVLPEQKGAEVDGNAGG